MNSRFTEPSTWAGFAGLLAALGLNIDPELIQPLSMALGGVSAIAVLLRERANDVG